MKLSVNKILYHWTTNIPKRFKVTEIQLSLLFKLIPVINFNIDMSIRYPILDINFLGLISLNIYKSTEEDHAGFYINLNLFGLDIDLNYHDVRHWDYDKDNWEESGKSEEWKRIGE